MSARADLRRARFGLGLALGGRAALLGLAGALAVVILAAAADLAVPLSYAARRGVGALAALAGTAVLLRALWRARAVRDLRDVALLAEERAPELRFALVTLAGTGAAAGPSPLEATVRAVAWRQRVIAAGSRALLRALAAASLAGLGLVLLPGASLRRVLRPSPGDALVRPGARRTADPLAVLVARISPPRYTRRPPSVVENPTVISALIGSRLEIRGRAPRPGLSASLDAGAVPVRTIGDTWSVAVTMPDSAAVFRVMEGLRERVVALDPRADASPTVTLLEPKRDTVLASATGVLALRASARDDIGLAGAQFEVMHTSGSGERFETRSWTVAARPLAGDTAAALSADLRLDTLRLLPGDVLHLRASARDGNTLSGPGRAASETRTIRIADRRDLSPLPLSAAGAVPVDTAYLSQRMLVRRADSLRRLEHRLRPPVFRDRAFALGGNQDALRERVNGVIVLLETVIGEETPMPTETSGLLRRAAAAMATATTHLSAARVGVALGPMRAAMELLDSARLAHRLYLRGVVARTSVDVDKVRLTGTGAASAGPREPRAALPDPRAALRTRVDAMLAGSGLEGRVPVDSVAFLLRDALRAAPDVAIPLRAALDSSRGAGDGALTRGLLRARRLLVRETVARAGLGAWGHIP